jgi:hypothetical protein
LSDTDRISDDPSVTASHIRSASPGTIAAKLSAIAAELTAGTGEPVTDYETQQVTALYLDRAAKAGNPVGDYIAYVVASVRKERDIRRLIASVTPTLSEIRKIPAEPPADTHPFTPESKHSDICTYPGCVLPRLNARHREVKSA